MPGVSIDSPGMFSVMAAMLQCIFMFLALSSSVVCSLSK